ncbi:MAG: HemK family protein methyltransferase [Candidatus Shikimatogenerans bostrichidophilus]|nr:MAG: HemK family protein methyltransferase [Candidatus Shikimatogenerans bostrichidophilus]
MYNFKKKIININNCYIMFVKKLISIYNKNEIYKLFFILFSHILKCNFNDIYYFFLIKKKINIKKYNFLIKSINKLLYKFPIQYIIKYTYFLNTKIYLNKNIFIPRQETEELVSYIINDKNNIKNNINKKLNIIDICTGSGCIAINIKKKLYNSNIYLLDYSNKILLKAKKNFYYNKIKCNNIKFIKFNILNKKKKYNKLLKKLPFFDIIISNPPYISYKMYYKYINKNIIYEPYKSIFVLYNDDIIFYKKIMFYFYKKKLNKNGILYFEITKKIKKKINIFLKKKFINDYFFFKKDINNNYRILKIIKNKI